MKLIRNLSLVISSASRTKRAGTTGFKPSVNCSVTILMLLLVNCTLVQCDCGWSIPSKDDALALLQHFPISILNSNETTMTIEECPSTRINIKLWKCPPNQQNTSESESTKYPPFPKDNLNTTTWQLVLLNCSSSQPVTWNTQSYTKSGLIQEVDLERQYWAQNNNASVYSVLLSLNVSLGDVGYNFTCEHHHLHHKCPLQKSFYLYGKQSDLLQTVTGAGTGTGAGGVPERSSRLEIDLQSDNENDDDDDGSKCESFVCKYNSGSNSTEHRNNANSEETFNPQSVSMAVVKCSNPVHCKLLMRHLDTTAEIQDAYLLNARETNVLRIPETYTGGVVFCRTNDKMKYQYVQFYRSVDEHKNNILLYDDRNQDRNSSHLEIEPSSVMEIHVSPYNDTNGNGSAQVTGMRLTCTISNFLFAKGSYWHLEDSNGSVLTPHILNSTEIAYNNIQSELKSYVAGRHEDLKSITCHAPWWNSKEWVSLTYPVSSPQIIAISKNMDLYDTDTNVNISCEARGSPLPEIVWKKDGKVVSHYSYSQMNTSTSSSLHFKHANTSIAGEYSCNANNTFGGVIYSVRVNVTRYPLMEYLMYSLSSILVVTIITLLVYLYNFWRQSKLDKEKIEDLLKKFIEGVPLPNEDDTDDSNEGSRQSLTGKQIAISLPYDTQKYEISIDEVEWDPDNLLTRLGEGNYGIVFEGRLHIRSLYLSDNAKLPVAIKTMKEWNPATVKDLLDEFKVLMYVNEGQHENIVGVIGAITKNSNGKILIVMDLCERGSLQKYLERNKGAFLDEFNPEADPPNYPAPIENYVNLAIRMTTSDLIRWSLQLARGMKYLDSKKIVHGDLAARNILVTNSGNVKITDFGFARNMEKHGSGHSPPVLPVNCMSPEILSKKNETFSTQSDVWAFGVTLWEIFSLGEEPYADFPRDVAYFKDQVYNRNYRLPRPRYASTEIYCIMEKCWDAKPENRPTFEDLVNFFENLSEPAANQQEQHQQLQPSPTTPSEQQTVNIVVPTNEEEQQQSTTAQTQPNLQPLPAINSNGYEPRNHFQSSEEISEKQPFNFLSQQRSRAAPTPQHLPIHLQSEYLPMDTFRQPDDTRPSLQSQPFHIADGYLPPSPHQEHEVPDLSQDVTYTFNRDYMPYDQAQEIGNCAA